MILKNYWNITEQKRLIFFLYVCKSEQLKRLLERIDNCEKHYKHKDDDWETRKHWEDYIKVYQSIFDNCNTISSDQNWYKINLITQKTIESFDPFPFLLNALASCRLQSFTNASLSTEGIGFCWAFKLLPIKNNTAQKKVKCFILYFETKVIALGILFNLEFGYSFCVV